MAKRFRSEWDKKQAARKRAAAIKGSLLVAATRSLDGLWATSNQLDSGFSPGERKAIADASYAIRSITGGWINRGRR